MDIKLKLLKVIILIKKIIFLKSMFMESTSVGSIKIIIKMLLNSLLGRLGMNIHKPITEIVDKENLYLIASTRESN